MDEKWAVDLGGVPQFCDNDGWTYGANMNVFEGFSALGSKVRALESWLHALQLVMDLCFLHKGPEQCICAAAALGLPACPMAAWKGAPPHGVSCSPAAREVLHAVRFDGEACFYWPRKCICINE